MRTFLAAVVSSILLVPITASAQLIAAKDGPIVYGHHHLTVTDLAAHRKFWVDGWAARPATARPTLERSPSPT